MTRAPAAGASRGVFLDTSLLLVGLIDFGSQSGPGQQAQHAASVAEPV